MLIAKKKKKKKRIIIARSKIGETLSIGHSSSVRKNDRGKVAGAGIKMTNPGRGRLRTRLSELSWVNIYIYRGAAGRKFFFRVGSRPRQAAEHCSDGTTL